MLCSLFSQEGNFVVLYLKGWLFCSIEYNEYTSEQLLPLFFYLELLKYLFSFSKVKRKMWAKFCSLHFTSWWLMIDSSFQVSADGNIATTTVIFIPDVKDQDKVLYCRAKNMHITADKMEDQWKIKVTCTAFTFTAPMGDILHNLITFITQILPTTPQPLLLLLCISVHHDKKVEDNGRISASGLWNPDIKAIIFKGQIPLDMEKKHSAIFKTDYVF